MKKILTILLVICLFAGCDSLNNTPTKKVEDLLNKYQTLDDDLLYNLDDSIESNNLTEEQKNTYRSIMEKQYKDLTYVIKDEEVDGDIATVKVEIEVYDYNIANIEATEYFKLNQGYFLDENGVVDEKKFIDYKLELMKDSDERVKFTVEFFVRKKNDKWELDDLTEDIRQKIHGIYSY